MRSRRIVLVCINLALVMTLWPAADDLMTRSSSPDAPLKRGSILPPTIKQRPEPAAPGRSLFRSGPPPAEDDGAPADPQTPSVIKLLGIVITDESRIALLERDGAIVRVEEGDDIGGWQVAEIGGRKIRLESAEQNLEIPLDKPADSR
jgi:hypothetical protein